MSSRYQKPFTIPEGFPSLLKDFAREVLRAQPDNIYEFGAKYFAELVDERGAEGGDEPVDIGQLNSAEISELVFSLFVKYDRDQNGVLDRKEFRNVLGSSSLALTNRQIMKIMSELDEDNDGKLSYTEFLPFTVELLQTIHAKQEMDMAREREEEAARGEVEDFLLHGMPRTELENMMREIFQRSDVDQSGSLSRKEFRECLKAAELGLTRKEVNAILSEVDENNDGEVSYEEFIPICFNILVERFKDEVMSNQVLQSSDQLEQELVATMAQYDESGSGKLPQKLIKRILEDMSYQFLGLSTFQILAVLSEEQPDAEGMVEIAKFAQTAAGMIYTMIDLSGQNLRVAAVEQLSRTEGAHFLRGLSVDDVKSILRKSFEDADADHSGTLTPDEISTVLRALGENLPLQERDINAIMSAIDDDENGVVDYLELVNFVYDLLDHLDREDYIRQYKETSTE